MPVNCFGYDVSIRPETMKAGEGFVLSIVDNTAGDHQVIYNDKTYFLYPVLKNKKEIYLPVRIGDSGIKEIRVRKIPADADTDEKTINLEIKKRKISFIALRESDEKMRDNQPSIAEQQTDIIASIKTRSDNKYWNKEFTLPLDASISTLFAVQRKGKSYSYYHKGLDFSASYGTPVKAANSGKVILCRRKLNIYGNSIIIDHGQGVVSCYFHLSKLFVQEGAWVRKNEKIAAVGSSGWATGPHLHFGVYLQGEAVDPIWWVNFTKQIVDGSKAQITLERRRINIKN